MTDEERDTRYLTEVPKRVPDGFVVVHNHVQHGPSTRAGVNGFRFWLRREGTGPALEVCDCGWESARLAEHYRVRDLYDPDAVG